MAFSYSDENFTVIGNLCFVHIYIDNKNFFDVPPAISDRMLFNSVIYPYASHDGEYDHTDIGLAVISNTGITLHSVHNKGYLICLFPIDSNK